MNTGKSSSELSASEVSEVQFEDRFALLFVGYVEGSTPKGGYKITEFHVRHDAVDIPTIPAVFVEKQYSADGVLLREGSSLQIVRKGDREYLEISCTGNCEPLLIPCSGVRNIVRLESKASARTP